LKENQNVAIYAGASGVGTAAIQICKILNLNAFAVVSS
jgi:NADPH:quinone reductase-like Zn-dependent oxidoreductase